MLAKKILITNYVFIILIYTYMFYVDLSDNFDNIFLLEGEDLEQYSINIVYELYYHIFGILIFLGANILVIFKKFISSESKSENNL